MKNKQSILFFLILLCTTYSHAQAWSGVLDPSRAIDWTQVGIPGGIPSGSWTQCVTSACKAVTSAGAGATLAQVNAAIASAPANTYVLLAAGTYSFSAGIVFNVSNVVLRGAGPTQTILKFTGGTNCAVNSNICIAPLHPQYSGSAAVQPGGSEACSWTAGYSKGTSSITLNNCGGAPPLNSMIILDQVNDTTDTNGVYICDDTANGCTWKGLGKGNNDGRIIGGITASSQQVTYVTSVNGSGSGPYTVGISPPIYMNNIRSSQSPGAWWTTQITQDGVENLTVDNSGDTAAGILLYSCYECWVKNIRSYEGYRDHILLEQNMRTVIRDSYFYKSQGSGSESYGIEFEEDGADLIENNIFDTLTNPIMSGQVQGNVIGYNLMTNNLPQGSYMQGSYYSHNAGNAMQLWEGNEMDTFIGCDDTWGSGVLTTIFRSQLTGWTAGVTYQTNPIDFESFCRGNNLVGNVLGKPTYHNQYESYPPSTGSANCSTTIDDIGWAEAGTTGCLTGTSGVSSDTLVRSTLMRWGNYDVVHAAVQWNSSEVPTTGVPYINGNPVPSSHSLANSWYLSSQPPFFPTPWGTPPWPPIGPDVTGGTAPGGYGYAIPAQLCYHNSATDNTYGKAFDANTCYIDPPGAPAPPTNLTATPQ